MVHLAAIPSSAEHAAEKAKKADKPIIDALKDKLNLGTQNDSDIYTTAVYGSRFAAQDLPKFEMPEGEMPKEIAYRMIKDDLSLDGNPMLKYVNILYMSAQHSLMVAQSCKFCYNLYGE
jgi:glutamate decarboxylase